MKRVKSWAAYRENWLDFGDCVAEVGTETMVALGVGILFTVMIIPCLLIVACGYRPNFEGEK